MRLVLPWASAFKVQGNFPNPWVFLLGFPLGSPPQSLMLPEIPCWVPSDFSGSVCENPDQSGLVRAVSPPFLHFSYRFYFPSALVRRLVERCRAPLH